MNWTKKQVAKAHAAVASEIQSGKRLPADYIACAKCGHLGPDRRHCWHHDNGYGDDHLLDVIPVCRSCHKKIHGPYGPRERPEYFGRFGLRLKDHCKRFGLTIREVARISGLTAGTVANIVHRRHEPTALTKRRIVEAVPELKRFENPTTNPMEA